MLFIISKCSQFELTQPNKVCPIYQILIWSVATIIFINFVFETRVNVFKTVPMIMLDFLWIKSDLICYTRFNLIRLY